MMLVIETAQSSGDWNIGHQRHDFSLIFFKRKKRESGYISIIPKVGLENIDPKP